MASRFVSGGRIDAETGENVAAASSSTEAGTGAGSPPSAAAAAAPVPAPAATLGGAKGSVEWEAVQKELDAERRRRDEARAKAVNEGGEKSLYDILQANKAAKQAAFEEQNKIKNQFRALDDDEIDFLDDVRARKREEEEKVRRETIEGLDAFRAAQRVQERRVSEDGEGVADDAGRQDGGEEWKSAGRKRKRREKHEMKGLVKRRTSEGVGKEEDSERTEGDAVETSREGGSGEGGKGAEEAAAVSVKETAAASATNTATTMSTTATAATTAAAPAAPPKPGLGLGDYGSDSDDD